MRISPKSRFAINAMIDLALRGVAGPVALASISQRQTISLSYLEQLFSQLRRAGLVNSTRGPGGGYSLAREASEISVAAIVQAVDDPLQELQAEAAELGASRALCERLYQQMLQHMAGVSLRSLADEQPQEAATAEQRAPRRAPAAPPVLKFHRPAVPNSVFAFGRSFAS